MQFDKSNVRWYTHYMIYFATVTSQGQITIPSKARKQLNIEKKKKVLLQIEGNRLIIEPEPDILELRGIFKTKKKIPFRVARKAFEEALGRDEV